MTTIMHGSTAVCGRSKENQLIYGRIQLASD